MHIHKSVVSICLGALCWSVTAAAAPVKSPTSPTCTTSLPAAGQYPSLFQKEIDARQQFTLQVRRLEAPANMYVHLGYVAWNNKGHVISINPTMVAVPGANLHFTLMNCLTATDIKEIQDYDPVTMGGAVDHVQGFTINTAEVMTPHGYTNIHTHGLHASAKAGTMTVEAGDEVLATFVAPQGDPSTDATVGTKQSYSIHIPSNQDPGLYWYHPHLHGEAQPTVFLGMSGAIVLLPKQKSNKDDTLAINYELHAHTDPSQHPAVFVIRDYAVPPVPSAITPAVMRSSRVRHNREAFLRRSPDQDVTPAGPPQLDDPRCTLFRGTVSSNPCLPDEVTPNNGTVPTLATLVTVNGVQTEQATDSDGQQWTKLKFTALQPSATDAMVRVLNASANTYINLSLTKAPPAEVNVNTSSFTAMQSVALTQWRRDGAPVPANSESTTSILVPPGGRAEFSATQVSADPLFLVSQAVDTGPAGDLVPPRTLSRLGSTSGPAAAEKLSAPQRSTRFAMLYDAAPAPAVTHRAFAFFEHDRPDCPKNTDCGTSFYLMDISGSALAPGSAPVNTATAYAMPMPNDRPTRELFDVHGSLLPEIPSIQVSLHNQPQVIEEWDIYNFTAENHAFHIHQLGFLVSAACSPAFRQRQDPSRSPDCRGNVGTSGDEHHETGLTLDVVNVAPAISTAKAGAKQGPVYPGRVHLRVPFTNDILGSFVMHCHLLEHEDNGMMMAVQVWPDEAPAAGLSAAPSNTPGMAMPHP